MATLSVRVSPGRLPPTIRTTPNSPSVCANVRMAAVRMPGQASGTSMRDESLPRRQAAAGRRITNVGRNRLEAALNRLDDERDVGNRRRQQQALERERQRLADERLEGLTERRTRTERDQEIEPEHRRRQHERHGDERFDQQLAAEMAHRQQAAEPDAERAAGSRWCPRRARARRGGPPSPWPAIVALRIRAFEESRARRRPAGRCRTASPSHPHA